MILSSKGRHRFFSSSDKLNAIQRIHNGETKATVSRGIGVPESTLRGWCKNEDRIRKNFNFDEKISMYGVKANKRQKLHDSLPLNLEWKERTKYEDMSYENRTSFPSIDLSQTDTELNAVQFNSFSSNDLTGYIPSSDLSSISSYRKHEEHMTSGYGTDIERSNSTKSNISMAAISSFSSLSDQSSMFDIGLSSKKTASNLFAPQNNNKAMVAGLTYSQKNGLRSVLPTPHCSLTARNLAEFQNQQKLGDQNNLYSTMPTAASPNISFMSTTPSMIPTATSIPSPVLSTPQSTSSTQSGDDEKVTQLFLQWCTLYNYYYTIMTRGVPNQEYRVNSAGKLNFFSNNNNCVKVECDISGVEAVKYGEMFLTWLNLYSDRSIATERIMQFKSLLEDVKISVERTNSSNDNVDL